MKRPARRPAPLLEAEAAAHWAELQRQAAFAPHGKKRERERRLKAFTTAALKAHAEQQGRGR